MRIRNREREATVVGASCAGADGNSITGIVDVDRQVGQETEVL